MRIARSANLDFGLLAAVLALIAIGLLAIYSASHITEGWGKVMRQAIWGGAGVIGMIALASLDYRLLARGRRVFLVLSCAALIATLFVTPINGARSWIDLGPFNLQPSEFVKLALILSLASYLVRFGPRLRGWPYFLRSLAIVAGPILLIGAQPDFGTAFILGVVWVTMVFVAGARWWMPASLVLGLVLLGLLAWHARLPGGVELIKPYQKKRLDFLHADPAGNGYHQLQARIAIGAGQLWGKGYLRGTQARRGFLPEQDTDFIFAVIGEEFGLLGCLVVLGLYLFVLFRLFRLAEEADTPFGQLIAVGIAAMLGIHAVINIGMCLTLLPVTGVPLSFVSYGGSNLLTSLLGLGILLNISRYREPRRRWAADERSLAMPPVG